MSPLLVAQALLLAFFAWFSWSVIQPAKRWRYRNIPGPIGLPIIGNLYGIITKSVPVLVQELEAKYGPVFKYWFGSDVWVVIADPDVARQLSLRFNTRAGLDHLNVFPHNERVTSELGILFTSDMALWRVARKAFDSALIIPSSLAQYTPTMDKCGLRLMNRLKQFAASGEAIDMWRELGTMTLEVVGECAYGVDFHSVVDGRDADEEQQKLGKQLVEACRTVFTQGAISEASLYVPVQLLFPFLGPLIQWLAETFPDKKFTKNMQSRRFIRQVSEEILARWKANHALHPEGVSVKASSEEDKKSAANKGTAKLGVVDRSFLNSMMVGRDVQPTANDAAEDRDATSANSRTANAKGGDPKLIKHGPMNDVEVIEQAFSFILAGYETTANTLAFVVYLMAANPGPEARLLQEVDAFGRTRSITSGDLDQFPYADAVVKEGLRLYTPATSTTRIAGQDIEVHGKTIVKGSIVTFPLHSYHTSANFWPRHDEFLPERFLPEGQATLGPSTPNAHMPFGAGSRMCPGYKFAQQEAKITLVRLYQNFTFRLVPGMPRVPKVKAALTSGPADGVPVVVHSREI